MKQLTAGDIRAYRDAILKKQDGKCLICKRPANRPVLDHSHQKKNKGTGQVRGVLCSNCNVLLAKVENNAPRYGVNSTDLPRILDNMSLYLLKPHYPYIHPSEKPKARKITATCYGKLQMKSRGKCPPMSKSGVLTKPLEDAFFKWKVPVEFYK